MNSERAYCLHHFVSGLSLYHRLTRLFWNQFVEYFFRCLWPNSLYHFPQLGVISVHVSSEFDVEGGTDKSKESSAK